MLQSAEALDPMNINHANPAAGRVHLFTCSKLWQLAMIDYSTTAVLYTTALIQPV